MEMPIKKPAALNLLRFVVQVGRGQSFGRMGGTGLEPVTSCMSSKRSSHLS